MRGEGAETYISRKIVEELDLEAPYASGTTPPTQYRDKETMGWHFRVRRDYINRKACDIALSIHENAGALTSVGMVMLVGNGPPAGQVKAAKLFMKYADPFDQGLRQGGVAENGAGQLQALNTRRSNHAYFELEFMSSIIVDNPGVRAQDPSRYQYQEMVQAGFINTAAEQIVAGVVEFLVDPQADIDSINYLGNLPNW
jgi:hypothetical protein